MIDRARVAAMLRKHARRSGPLAATGLALALARSLIASGAPEPTEQGVAAALGEAVSGSVATDDLVWEPGGSAAADLLWGRPVTFLARASAPPGAPRDVYRARVQIAPGGRVLRVAAVERRTDTPLADEHHLLAHGRRLAWLTRGAGGEHGATALFAPSAASGGVWSLVADGVSAGAGLPPRRAVHAVLASPVDDLRAELRDEGLVLAIVQRGSRMAALIDVERATATISGEGPSLAVVAERWHPRSLLPRAWTSAGIETRAGGDLEEVALDADGTFPPAGPAWRGAIAGRAPVAGDRGPPAAVARAWVGEGSARVELIAFDRRQIAVRIVPGPGAPAARSGLPGTGQLQGVEPDSILAWSEIAPLGPGGAVEGGREIAPLSPDAATLWSDPAGVVEIGAAPATAPYGALQSPEPAAGEAVMAWCRTAAGAIVLAAAPAGDRAAIARALEPLSCSGIIWFAASVDALPAPGPLPSGRNAPFAAFSRSSTFPDGRSEPWTASPGKQPEPGWRPAILTREESALGTPVKVTAFVAGRFSWMLRAGKGERSHRTGGTFPEVLEPAARERAVAALGLGIAQRKKPNGLTIDGSTGHRYAARGAVLMAGPRGIRLLRSPELRGDPPGDASELPLTAESGAATEAARKRGLLHERQDLCVLPDGTALVATARFDSHEAAVEVLLRLGCTEVAALDRGLDLPSRTLRATPDTPLDESFEDTTLLALTPGP